jgi:uncharacterized protein YjbI with pentapeptide repeats
VQAPFSLAPERVASQTLDSHAAAMRQLQQEALAAARENPTGADGKFTMLDFYKAADAIITRENGKLQAAGAPQNEQIKLSQLVDFRGQKLEGMEFRKEHFDFSPGGLEALYNEHDFSPGALDEIERGISFNQTEIANSTFIPATTFEALSVDRGSHVRLENVTFDGMSGDDRLVLGTTPDGKPHQNLYFRGINGGTLEIAKDTMVEHVHAEGAVMSIEMGERSQLTNLHTDSKTHILSFRAEPGARLEKAELRDTTIAPDSNLRGTTWSNVELNGVNIAGVDFSGARFDNVTWNNQKLDPANGFAPLLAAGVSESQLPKIDNIAYGSEQHKAWVAMAELQRAVANFGSTPPATSSLAPQVAPEAVPFRLAVADVGMDTIQTQNLPTTPEAVANRVARNEAFAESAAPLAARNSDSA